MLQVKPVVELTIDKNSPEITGLIHCSHGEETGRTLSQPKATEEFLISIQRIPSLFRSDFDCVLIW